jgi:hypothetical protein
MNSNKLAIVLALLLGACSAAEESSEELDQATQALPKGHGSSFSCTVEQCDGTMNPFGICSHSINEVCVECKAGTHTGTCAGSLSCEEQNCPPPKPTQAHP